MKTNKRRKGRRITDRCADLLDNLDVKTLTLAGQLLELQVDKREAIAMYVKTLSKITQLVKPTR